MKKTVTLIACAILAGCASPSNQLVWYNPSKSQYEAEQDFRTAQYEATKYGYVAPSSMGDPIASGAASGVQTFFRKNEIMSAYMRSRGYTLVKRSAIPSSPISLPPSSTAPAGLTPSGTGGIQPFLYYHEGEYLEILSFPDRQKERDGMRVGDKITKVQGRDVKSLSMGEVHRLLTGSVGDTRELTVESGGMPKAITVKLIHDTK